MLTDVWGAFLDILPGEWDIFKERFIWSFLLRPATCFRRRSPT